MTVSFLTATNAQQDISKAFLLARKAKKHGRAAASERSGVPEPTIRRFEDTGNISFRQFLMLTEAYGNLEGMLSIFSCDKPRTMAELVQASKKQS